MSTTPLEYIQAHHSEMLSRGVTSYHLLPFEVDLFVQGLLPLFRTSEKFEEVRKNLFAGNIVISGIRVSVGSVVRIKPTMAGGLVGAYGNTEKYTWPPQFAGKGQPHTAPNKSGSAWLPDDEVYMNAAHREFIRRQRGY